MKETKEELFIVRDIIMIYVYFRQNSMYMHKTQVKIYAHIIKSIQLTNPKLIMLIKICVSAAAILFNMNLVITMFIA